MQSSGGLATLEEAAGNAARTVLSGPAGGAAAAAVLAAALDEPHPLCLDMGGTSCDVSVIRDGQAQEADGREIAGRAIALPMIDIETVGAGGGSIAWRDPGGALRVGPASAGSEPGPACYGRGGDDPTVTDANLVLGRLPSSLGDLHLDHEAAQAAIKPLADSLGLGLAQCAAGIVRVANAEMVRAMRVMTVQRGVDPRDFTLLAFGGAGPLHACELARELGMERIAVPEQAGMLSALGLAAADRRRDGSRTVMLTGFTDADLGDLASGDEVAWHLRYRGQSHELVLRGVPPVAARLREAFHAEHQRLYGYRDPSSEIELVTVRNSEVRPGPDIVLQGRTAAPLAGPHVLPLPGCTLFIAEGWSGHRDHTGTWRLRWTR
jgi:N-methylhydantoinase A/oxoprolinase/acetone carboxylase beta subunit